MFQRRARNCATKIELACNEKNFALGNRKGGRRSNGRVSRRVITSNTHRISFRARDGRVGRARKKATSTRKERTSVSGDEREREKWNSCPRKCGNLEAGGRDFVLLGKLARILGKRGRNNLFANPSKTLRGTRATSKVFYESSALNKISNGQINTEEGNTRNRGEGHRWKFDREFDVATRGNEVGNGKKGKKRKKEG